MLGTALGALFGLMFVAVGLVAAVELLRAIVFGHWGDVVVYGLVVAMTWIPMVVSYKRMREERRRIAAVRRRWAKAEAKKAKKARKKARRRAERQSHAE